MDQSKPLFTVVCAEPEGEVLRNVYPMVFDQANLQKFHNHARKFPTLFGKEIKDTKEFMEVFAYVNTDKTIGLNGVFYVVDDFVGVFYITDFDAREKSALVHYSFFDRRHKGREHLVQVMLKYVMLQFELRKVYAEIPGYATEHTKTFVRKMGFKCIGLKRAAVTFKGREHGVLLYDLLREEVLTHGQS